MNAYIAAIPGQWYRNPASGDVFQILGIDENARTINIQHVDGSRELTSFDEWMTRHVETGEPPRGRDREPVPP